MLDIKSDDGKKLCVPDANMIDEKHATFPAYQLTELQTYDVRRYCSLFEKGVAEDEKYEVDRTYYWVT